MAYLMVELVLLPEKYGNLLQEREINVFEKFSGDYEVAWHLNHLKSLSLTSPGSNKEISKLVKNRRLAHLSKMEEVGLS